MRARTLIHPFGARARAPYGPPRRRALDPRAVMAVEACVRTWPGYHAAHVQVTEWISVDPRHVPHILVLTLVERGVSRVLVVEEASERIHRARAPASTGHVVGDTSTSARNSISP